ncbi:pyridoxamine 5'-phosphate oxidase family protein [Streptomyces sp. NPDC101171]|uniref:pyridoxamine 5'-phosphate oxidase family protein n=1 Tax=Streptomyces sp. NPDC101171 TaxID=3366122 RepID=UPI0037FBD9BB
MVRAASATVARARTVTGGTVIAPTTGEATPPPHGPRRTIEPDRDEVLRLLGGVPFGRIVFARHALPTVRPVNRVLDGGDIAIRTHDGAALQRPARCAGGVDGAARPRADRC